MHIIPPLINLLCKTGTLKPKLSTFILQLSKEINGLTLKDDVMEPRMKTFLVGFMGSGKSYWGAKLAEYLNVPFYDLDEVIVEKEGRSIESIFAEEGEEYFRIVEKNTLYDITERADSTEGFVVSCGGGTPCFFNNIEYMKKHGKVVWINPPIDILWQRLLREKNKRPLLQEISDDDLRHYIQRKLGERKMYYEKADLVINEEAISLELFLETADHA